MLHTLLWHKQQLQWGDIKTGITTVRYTSESTKSIPRKHFRFAFVDPIASGVKGGPTAAKKAMPDHIPQSIHFVI